MIQKTSKHINIKILKEFKLKVLFISNVFFPYDNFRRYQEISGRIFGNFDSKF